MVHNLGDRMYGLWALAGAFIGCYGLLDLGLSSAVQRHIELYRKIIQSRQ
jgi:O-antigen/teichoic acid export membrane protein